MSNVPGSITILDFIDTEPEMQSPVVKTGRRVVSHSSIDTLLDIFFFFWDQRFFKSK